MNLKFAALFIELSSIENPQPIAIIDLELLRIFYKLKGGEGKKKTNSELQTLFGQLLFTNRKLETFVRFDRIAINPAPPSSNLEFMI